MPGYKAISTGNIFILRCEFDSRVYPELVRRTRESPRFQVRDVCKCGQCSFKEKKGKLKPGEAGSWGRSIGMGRSLGGRRAKGGRLGRWTGLRCLTAMDSSLPGRGACFPACLTCQSYCRGRQHGCLPARALAGMAHKAWCFPGRASRSLPSCPHTCPYTLPSPCPFQPGFAQPKLNPALQKPGTAACPHLPKWNPAGGTKSGKPS